MFKKISFSLCIALAVLTSAQAGCATRRTVIETETPAPAVVVHDDGDHGLFGIVGDIIALPFRAVGALLSAIF